MTSPTFSKKLLSWFDRHGRKDLPWQVNKTPYRVFISEIMLQQTQVRTVIPYYLRFLSTFPDIQSLAAAHEDGVLHLWAGLGYYSRARNLHKAAKMVMNEYHGHFPDTHESLLTLPGVGDSTAGAILSIAYQQPATILDGNVKRVLARVHGITTPINQKETLNQLWELAVHYTPKKRSADYTQAIMDLGATVCTRRKPACTTCPMASICMAKKLGLTSQIPAKTAAKPLPVKTATFLVVEVNRHVLLCKRPPTGIWGGLWSLPQIDGKPNTKSILKHTKEQWGVLPAARELLTPFRHTFTHYHLDIYPVLIRLDQKSAGKIIEQAHQIWYNTLKPKAIGLPKPVQTILREY